jgi:hypothetical protein
MYRNGVDFLKSMNDAGNADLALAYATTWDIMVTNKWS